MSGKLLDDLRQQIASGQALIVVGAGVSIGATGDAPTASWTGLIEHGIARVEAIVPSLPDGWAELSRRQLASGEVNWLLGVADDVTVRLGGPGGGEYRRWLRDAVGELQVEDPATIEALFALRAPIATTNYDGLLEAVTGWQPVTWRDGSRVQRVLRKDEDGILHLHGFWAEPRSVVLGIRSYEDVLRDGAAQALQQATMTVRSLVFVGFGAGLSDPNFAALRAWFAQRFADSEYRHYRLCQASEQATVAAAHAPEERIVPLVYGERHAELAPFLRSLAPVAPTTAAATAPALAPVSALPPAPLCVGRDAQLDELASDLAGGGGPIVVLGPPGIGKSTVCVAAAHDARVTERFGERRWFVRCDGTTSAHALLAAIADALGVSSVTGPDGLLPGVLAALQTAEALILLDNLETPWGHDARATEELLAQLAAMPSLTLVAAVRGAARPGGLRWDRLITVVPLERDDARVVFLSIAGDGYAEDPHLDTLLDELDGLPLAVELLAHAAQGEPNLHGLTQRWQTERVALLERLGGGDPGLSVSASVEVSWNSPLMRPEGRRLLSLLGQLPDGIAHTDLPQLLHEEAHAAASNARQLGLAFDAHDRLRALAPIREHLARHPPEDDLDARLVGHYLRLAAEGLGIGWRGGGQLVRRILLEAGNLNRLFERTDLDPIRKQPALLGVLRFVERSGNQIPAVMATAHGMSEEPGTTDADVTRVRLALGDILLGRNDLDAARRLFEDAIAHYAQRDDDTERARVIERLGDAALRVGDGASATEHFTHALRLFSESGDALDVANCMYGLGRAAMTANDPATARQQFERALPLYAEADDPLGQANCIGDLGHLALQSSDPRAAADYYLQSQQLAEQAGDVQGLAISLYGIGLAAAQDSDTEVARTMLLRALASFEQMQDAHAVGVVELQLARIAATAEQRSRHLAGARNAWQSINRPDLIERHLEDDAVGGAPRGSDRSPPSV